jgi:RNA polymerase sigma-70 factor (sigma-E family)
VTVTVARRPLAVEVGLHVRRGGGTGENVMCVRPGDGASGTAPVASFGEGGDGIDLDTDADTAIALLYQARWTPLVRLAALLTQDASIAEEIVQDSFVSLHRRWSALADRSAAHAYLRTSVVNRARSALRHRGVEERNRQPGPPPPAGPEERALQADSDAEVMAALRTLSRRQQEVLVLRYFGDYSERDIALTLGLSKGAVKSHAHRGLAALRSALDASAPLRGGRP